MEKKCAEVAGRFQVQHECSVLVDHAASGPDGAELHEEEIEFRRQTSVGILDPRALCSGNEGFVELGVRDADVPPVGALWTTDSPERAETVVDCRRQRPNACAEYVRERIGDGRPLERGCGGQPGTRSSAGSANTKQPA